MSTSVQSYNIFPLPLRVAHFPATCKIEAKWMFGHLDINSDGLLSITEMYDLEHDENERCIKPFIDTCDKDKDDNLTPYEWCRCFEKTDRPCAAVRRRLDNDLLGNCRSKSSAISKQNKSNEFVSKFSFQAATLPIATFSAFTSRPSAILPSAFAGASTNMALSSLTHAPVASPIAVSNLNALAFSSNVINCRFFFSYFLFPDEVINNAAKLAWNDEDAESDDDDSTEGSADNFLVF